MGAAPRVAFFPDSFHEVNGVAHTSRNFVAYARRHGLPMLCVRAAAPGVRGDAVLSTDGSITSLELPRGRFSFGLEKDLRFDPLFSRYGKQVQRALQQFNPDVIHMTGPSEMGMFAAYSAWRMRIPLVASWHTNVHEYAARRSAKLGRTLPRWIEGAVLDVTSRFYRLAKVLYAPNEELCALLERKTGKPCRVMRRGVNTELFSPAKRQRNGKDERTWFGYVGRLSVEKNVDVLPALAAAIRRDDAATPLISVVGHGDEEAALRKAMPNAIFHSVLRGEALAQAYADMDIFVFPSETDTFGNVVLEALASGVPAVVTRGGGPKFIVRDGETGVICDKEHFVNEAVALMNDWPRRVRMQKAAREYALQCTWDAIFDGVYDGYGEALASHQKA